MGPCVRRDDGRWIYAGTASDRISRRTNRRSRAARAHPRFKSGSIDPPGSMRDCWSAPCSASTSPASFGRGPATHRRRIDWLEDLAHRRLGGEPVARILGPREFWGLPLKLSAATPVPRPDTETVVELALEMLRASLLPIVRYGSPTSAPARARSCWRCCRIAARGWDRHRHQRGSATNSPSNAVNLGLADRASFIACDYASGLSGAFDLIVSNPPYIRSADIAGLATEVREISIRLRARRRSGRV